MTHGTTSPLSTSGEPEKITVETLDFSEITRKSLSEKEELGAALVKKEGVHPLTGVEELVNTRIAPDDGWVWDKHCFGLFIPKQTIPEAVVYVKLVCLPEEDGKIKNFDLPGNIKNILEDKVKPIQNPNAAIFYTITNTARRGEPDYHAPEIQNRTAPERLINEVANKLKERGIRYFSTLSPLREKDKIVGLKGFYTWLEKGLKEKEAELVTKEEQQQIQQLAKTFCDAKEDTSTLQCLNLLRQKYTEIGTREGGKEAQRFIQQIMKDLGAHYLVNNDGQPNANDNTHTHHDPVARFHLRNGAMVANFHWASADETTVSETIGGAGLMVNYRYELDHLNTRREAFRNRGEIVMDLALENAHQKRLEKLSAPKAIVRSVELDNKSVAPSPGRGV